MSIVEPVESASQYDLPVLGLDDLHFRGLFISNQSEGLGQSSTEQNTHIQLGTELGGL